MGCLEGLRVGCMLGVTGVGFIDCFPKLTAGFRVVGLTDGAEEGASVGMLEGYDNGAGGTAGPGDERSVWAPINEGIVEGPNVGRDVKVGPGDGCPVGREDWLGSCVDGGGVRGARVGVYRDKKPIPTVGNVPRSVSGLLGNNVGVLNSLSPNASALVVGTGVADIPGDTMEGTESGTLAGLGVALGEGAGVRKRLPGRNTFESRGTKAPEGRSFSMLLFPLFK